MKRIKGFIAVFLLLVMFAGCLEVVQAETVIYTSPPEDNYLFSYIHYDYNGLIFDYSTHSVGDWVWGTVTQQPLHLTPMNFTGWRNDSHSVPYYMALPSGMNEYSVVLTAELYPNQFLHSIQIQSFEQGGLFYVLPAPATPVTLTVRNFIVLDGVHMLGSGIEVFVDGVLVASQGSTGPGMESVHMRPIFNQAAYRAPILNVSDIKVQTTTPVNWYADISSTYGYTTTKKIPETAGSTLTDLTLTGATDPRLSATGATYDYIGAYQHTYEARDADYYNITDLLYKDDKTETIKSRKISVYTTDAPYLYIKYGSNAKASLIGQTYDANSLTPLPCGGEEGWTNQPLNISVDPNTIQGNFDTVIKSPSDAAITTPNGIATKNNYNVQTLSSGTTIEGVLTERNVASNELSSVVQGKVKIDTTLPVPVASHQGGISFTDHSYDDLSGKSDINKSLIALVPTGGSVPAKDVATEFSAITPKAPGLYDVYVWAFDKAGNEAMANIGTFEVDGEVIIKKDTDLGATRHTANSADCGGNGSLEREVGCGSGCVVGAEQGIVENIDFTYELTIENTDTTKNAVGTFTDYLPKGFYKTKIPTIAGTGIDNLNATFIEDGGVNDGQWRITGNYSLGKGASTKVSIGVTAPKRADIEDSTKIFSNQASITWTLDPSGTPISGTATSNYANHEITTSQSAETKFTKVGADDTTHGIAGAKFALYKWTGDEIDYIGHEDDILDANKLDGGEISEFWVRAKKDAEDGTTSDVFSSDSAGQVVLGELPSGTYTLIEVQSPNGYELPVGQWTLVINASNTDSGDNDWKIEYKAKSASTLPPAVIRVPGVGANPPSYRIINTKPFSIGMTGMNGTGGIIVLGLALMLIAGIGYSLYHFKNKR